MALNALITASFSKAIDATTLTASSFSVKQGAASVAGSLVYGPGTSATFTPASALTAGTLYTATLTTGI